MLAAMVLLALAADAMPGNGERVTFGVDGVQGRLAVGLYAHTAVVDYDGDGAPDLIVASPDRPYNGIYYFHNIGTRQQPLFAKAERWGPSVHDLTAGDFNGDGKIDLVYRGGYFSDVRANKLAKPVDVKLPRDYHIGRDDSYFPVDWDGDGKIDVLNGVSDWRDYGWDDAYDATGRWQRGPLHGYVYFFRNTGSNDSPVYQKPVRLPGIDTYGSPVPQAFDWFKRGVLDLFTGTFVDTMHLRKSTGKRGEFEPPIEIPHRPVNCVIQPRVVDWHGDGRLSLVIGEEGGNVTFLENTAPAGQAPKWAEPIYFQQKDPFVKSASLIRPVAVDWDNDGDLDIVAGNSSGFLHWIENTGTRQKAVFRDRGNLMAAGKEIRRTAGPNGSVQGPAEEKWGYSNPSVADWDMDGTLDIVVNDIWGQVVWYRGIKGDPMHLEPMRDIEVEWTTARPPKPDWVWWEPKPKQLVTQWRTTPKVVDWNRDGLPDIVMLNHQGYLALFPRRRCGNGKLCLGEPQRIFVAGNGHFLELSRGRAGKSGRRKIELVDWNGDGKLDLLTDSDEGPVWYENTGSHEKPVMELRGTVVKAKLAGHNPTPNAADWNGDGKLDLLIGAEDGFLYYFDRNYIDGLAR